MSFRKSIITANIIVFSSLAIILAAIKAEIPYPILPYLKFDLAEIPVMIVLLIFGPIPALFTEVIHWIALTITHGTVIGPLMKFLAVVPMILGFWLGILIYKRINKYRKYNLAVGLSLGVSLGVILRVVVCTGTNIVLFLFIAPEYISYAQSLLSLMGISAATTLDVILWTLVFTGVFNTIHVPFSSFIAIIVVKATAIQLPNLSKTMWIPQLRKSQKKVQKS